jgi:hypothetical protein
MSAASRRPPSGSLPFCAFGRSRTVTALTQLRRKHATRRAATENDNIEANPLAYARRSYDAPLRTTTRAASNPDRLGMGLGTGSSVLRDAQRRSGRVRARTVRVSCRENALGSAHGKQGSTVRVRQRALQKPRKSGFPFRVVLHELQFAQGMEPFMELSDLERPLSLSTHRAISSDSAELSRASAWRSWRGTSQNISSRSCAGRTIIASASRRASWANRGQGPWWAVFSQRRP